MNWTAIGAIGEILGAAGVIITLVYLARQVRQNTRATRLSTAQSIATAARDWNRPLLLDPELAWTFQVGTEDPTQLDPKEQARFVELCFSLFRMFEDAHYQYHSGALDPNIWSGYEALYAAYAKAPGFQAYWAKRHSIVPGPRQRQTSPSHSSIVPTGHGWMPSWTVAQAAAARQRRIKNRITQAPPIHGEGRLKIPGQNQTSDRHTQPRRSPSRL